MQCKKFDNLFRHGFYFDCIRVREGKPHPSRRRLLGLLTQSSISLPYIIRAPPTAPSPREICKRAKHPCRPRREEGEGDRFSGGRRKSCEMRSFRHFLAKMPPPSKREANIFPFPQAQKPRTNHNNSSRSTPLLFAFCSKIPAPGGIFSFFILTNSFI